MADRGETAQHDHRHLRFRHVHLRELHLPSGRKVHVASTPEEQAEMSRTLSKSLDNGELDLMLHGSDEHIEAIKAVHEHHNLRKEELREKHREIYDEVEELLTHLGHLQAELQSVASGSVSLEGNFSKFGYNAQLRAKDDVPSSRFPSSLSEPSQDRDGSGSAEQLMFWKRPILRQYFHKGLIYRSSSSGEVASFELFVDLVYVAIIGVIGETAAEHPDGASFLHFAIEFLMAMKIWNDLTTWVDWLETNDILHRAFVALYLVFLLGFATNLQNAFESTYLALVSWYLAERFFIGIYYVWIAYLIPMVRGSMAWQAVANVVCSALWIASIHVQGSSRLALIWIALLADFYLGNVLAAFAVEQGKKARARSGKPENWMQRWFHAYPALNIEHRVERMNAFVTLVLGASILSIIFQVQSVDIPLSTFFGKAALVIIQAFAFNWIYFDIDGANIHMHAIRRSIYASMTWMFGHIPYIMGLILAAGASGPLVLAHDSSSADYHILGEAFHERSEEHVSSGLRWFYAASIGVALISQAVISWAHVHKTLQPTNTSKSVRLAVKCAVGIVLICLPLAGRLTSLGLMAISCSLVLFVLIVDIFGAHCKGQSFWTGALCPKKHGRVYHCSKQLSGVNGNENGKDVATTEAEVDATAV